MQQKRGIKKWMKGLKMFHQCCMQQNATKITPFQAFGWILLDATVSKSIVACSKMLHRLQSLLVENGFRLHQTKQLKKKASKQFFGAKSKNVLHRDTYYMQSDIPTFVVYTSDQQYGSFAYRWKPQNVRRHAKQLVLSSSSKRMTAKNIQFFQFSFFFCMKILLFFTVFLSFV